ncbi:hypothetical protein BpHYR1_041415 [Brachionus plicatilis]|uniref:Uncharacterized protein n=1 Tax=Brachionus plicatilis TaxID=10195 RepID=A0A3M7PU10_BRAPC|nr:hypothetical protein BpHYR1_041415 [Brachionus plicatilis]
MNIQNLEMNIDKKEGADQNNRNSKEFYETNKTRDDCNLSTELDEEEVFRSEKEDAEISDSVMEDSEISCSELDLEENISSENEDGEISDSLEEDGEILCPKLDEEVSSLVKDDCDISSTVKNDVQLEEQISINQHTSFLNSHYVFEVENMLNAMNKQFALEKKELKIKINDLQEEIKILPERNTQKHVLFRNVSEDYEKVVKEQELSEQETSNIKRELEKSMIRFKNLEDDHEDLKKTYEDIQKDNSLLQSTIKNNSSLIAELKNSLSKESEQFNQFQIKKENLSICNENEQEMSDLSERLNEAIKSNEELKDAYEIKIKKTAEEFESILKENNEKLKAKDERLKELEQKIKQNESMTSNLESDQKAIFEKLRTSKDQGIITFRSNIEYGNLV